MRNLISRIFSLSLLLVLPAAGIYLRGAGVDQYLEFPPLTRYVKHAGPSWLVFTLLAAVIIGFLMPFVRRFLRASGATGIPAQPMSDFPWWGAAAALMCLLSWTVSWSRFSWFKSFQQYTFIPLWFSFVFLLNGVSHWLKGTSLLERMPMKFFLLFPLSSLFWWYFEYLNRFVQNWYYVGIEDFSPVEYCVTASISFSTVLPAVLSMNELLKVCSRFEKAFGSLMPLRFQASRSAAISVLMLSSAGLLAIGILPDILFPLLWMAPLLIFTSVDSLLDIPHVFQGISHGNWTGVCRLAASGLICGFFWEMWNYYSYAKWIYSIPFVGQFRIFEMPVLGYAGYLPFGLECAVAASMVIGLREILESRALSRPCPGS